jgi:hypothetical protein
MKINSDNVFTATERIFLREAGVAVLRNIYQRYFALDIRGSSLSTRSQLHTRGMCVWYTVHINRR